MRSHFFQPAFVEEADDVVYYSSTNLNAPPPAPPVARQSTCLDTDSHFDCDCDYECVSVDKSDEDRFYRNNMTLEQIRQLYKSTPNFLHNTDSDCVEHERSAVGGNCPLHRLQRQSPSGYKTSH